MTAERAEGSGLGAVEWPGRDSHLPTAPATIVLFAWLYLTASPDGSEGENLLTMPTTSGIIGVPASLRSD